MQAEEFGCGMDGVLRERREALRGIINGIDAETWNPMTDARIPERYSWSSLDRKAPNKQALQNRMNLAVEPAVPLLGVVCPFTHQKGIHLIAAAAAGLIEAPAQLCILLRRHPDRHAPPPALAAPH